MKLGRPKGSFKYKVGTRFGTRVIVERFDDINVVRVRCDCGDEANISLQNLREGRRCRACWLRLIKRTVSFPVRKLNDAQAYARFAAQEARQSADYRGGEKVGQFTPGTTPAEGSEG